RWLTVLLLYPVCSVLPQEVLYRRFLFARWRALGGSDAWALGASAAAFAGLHAIYGNVCAVTLTLVGGWFFADTYRRTGSLGLVCLEHALYGALIFTMGLGSYFSPPMT